jgi:hypothetical protein
MPSPLDDLQGVPGPVGDVQRDIAANPAMPYETPSQTAQRGMQVAQAKARVQRYRAGDFAMRDIPTYTDPAGNVDAIRDETGAALKHFDKRHGIAYDSSGAPKKISYGETGGPIVHDPFEGVGPTTDPKTGHRYRIVPGLPWDHVDQDADIAARVAREEREKAIKKEATARGGWHTLTSRELSGAKHDIKKQFAALKDIDGMDEPTARSVIDAHYAQETKSLKPSFGGFLSSEATKQESAARQAEVEQRRAASQAQLGRIYQLRDIERANLERQQALAAERLQMAGGVAPGLSAAAPIAQPAVAPNGAPVAAPAQPGAPAEQDNRSQWEYWTGRLGSGIDKYQATNWMALALAENVTGMGNAQASLAHAKANEEQAGKFQTRGPDKFTDIESPGGFARWFGNTIVDLLPQIAETLTLAAAGAAAGSSAPGAGNAAGAIAGIFGRGAVKSLVTKEASCSRGGGGSRSRRACERKPSERTQGRSEATRGKGRRFPWFVRFQLQGKRGRDLRQPARGPRRTGRPGRNSHAPVHGAHSGDGFHCPSAYRVQVLR